jgi:hypothetical protein
MRSQRRRRRVGVVEGWFIGWKAYDGKKKVPAVIEPTTGTQTSITGGGGYFSDAGSIPAAFRALL